jgi:hypothetical protein
MGWCIGYYFEPFDVFLDCEIKEKKQTAKYLTNSTREIKD